MNLFFPEDFQSVSSLDELITNSEHCIWPCIDPALSDRTKIIDFGTPEFGFNPDLEERGDDRMLSSGWALLCVKSCAYLRDFLIYTRSGDLILANPRWRHGWMIDYYGIDREQILRRLLMTHALRLLFDIVKSNFETDNDLIVNEPASTHTGHVHGHWLFEQLLPLGLWDAIDFYPTIHTMWLKTYQTQLLELANYRGNLQQTLSPILLYKNLLLWVPWSDEPGRQRAGYGFRDGQIYPQRCYNQYDMWWNPGSVPLDFCESLGSKAPKALGKGECIFVTRGAAHHSVCLNEYDVIEVANNLGFSIVNPDLLSGMEEAAIFNRAKVIAGITGGGLENAVFSKRGATLISICGTDSYRETLAHLAAFKELSFTRIRGPQFTSVDRFQEFGSASNFVADIAKVREVLVRALYV